MVWAAQHNLNHSKILASFIVFATKAPRPQPLIYSMPAFFEQAELDNPCCPDRFLSYFLVKNHSKWQAG